MLQLLTLVALLQSAPNTKTTLDPEYCYAVVENEDTQLTPDADMDVCKKLIKKINPEYFNN